MKPDNPYLEAMRYIENANTQLRLAGKEGKYYSDEKYIHSACGTAYIGMLKALDFLFDIKKIPKKRGKKSIDFYRRNLALIDKKLLNSLNNGFRLLHVEGYYEGMTDIKALEAGFENALSIINALKPFSKNGSE